MATTIHEVGRARASVVGTESETIFVFAHPSTSYLDTFLTESLLWHGAGVIGVDGRYVTDGDDDLSFETAADDVAAALSALVPDGKQLVLVGHSGGAPLMALLQVRFRIAEAVVLLAAHPSRADLLEHWIDPCFDAEGARDPSLDLYHPDRAYPLSEAFLRDYRKKQRERVQRVAASAAAHLRAGRPEERLRIPHLFADPRFVDRTQDPNQRRGEHPFGPPAEVNRREGFLADGVTARSFFDQWYLPTTSANLLQLAPYLDVPVLSVAFGADAVVFPSQSLRVATALPSGSTAWTLEGAAHNPKDQPDHLDALSRKMLAWLSHLPRPGSAQSG